MTILHKTIGALAIALTCLVIAVSADLFRRFGLSLYTEQYLAGLLAIAMPLFYLAVPVRGPRKREVLPPWYDLAAALVSFVCCAYVAVRFPALSDLVSARPWDGLIVAACSCCSCLKDSVGPSAARFSTRQSDSSCLPCSAAICRVSSPRSPFLPAV